MTSQFLLTNMPSPRGSRLMTSGCTLKTLVRLCRSQARGAEIIDLSGVLDRVLGADQLDHGAHILRRVQSLYQVVVAIGEDLANEVIRAIGDGTADIGDALCGEERVDAGVSALIDQIVDLFACEHAELVENRIDRETISLVFSDLRRGGTF